MSSVTEKKIVFVEGDDVRVLKGIIEEEEDDYFILLKRRDGNYRINKKFIVKIEEGNDE